MDSTIFKFILRYSTKQQIYLLVMTGISFPFLYMSLDLPKTIINQAIGGRDFPVEYFGVQLSQLEYLFSLSGMFLLLVCVNGAFKFQINVYRGQLGERMLRRLRYDLYARVLRFPLPHFRRVSQGEIIPMITAEVEPLGGFIGDSISLPAFQGGTLLTILVFMFVQDPVLGLAAIALYPIQAYMIPKLQRRVNALGKERVKNVRKMSDRIGETISGAEELHANDGSRLALAQFTDRLGIIFDIRYEIYRRKFFIKFLNNFIAQLTPFFFYSIGGYEVIQGNLSFGALVASLAAYKDLSGPWKELLTYYQRMEDARIKYGQVIEQFDPPGAMEEDIQSAEIEADFKLDREVSARNLGLTDEDGQALIESVSFRSEGSNKIAVVGPAGGGKETLVLLLARLLSPTAGQVAYGDKTLADLPETATGRRMAYVGPAAYLFSNSIRENILLGAKHKPNFVEASTESGEWKNDRQKAVDSGNSTDNPEADWLDYDAIGGSESGQIDQRLAELLKIVDMEDDVYSLGLRGTIDPAERPEIAERIMEARAKLRDRLAKPDMSELVEPFDEERYNTNATVAENLLFGTPKGDGFDLDNLAHNDYVRSILDKVGLTDEFLRIGREVAATMVELFSDLPPDHEFFSQFAFISADDLPEYQALLGRAERLGMDKLTQEENDSLLSLPFKLAPARHRLGLIDEAAQAKLLEARKVFAADLPESLAGSLEFFSAERYNASASIQDNILFGKVAYGNADAAGRVGAALSETVVELDLRPAIINVGLDFEVGIGGTRLGSAQRQKVAIARALLRRPDVLILNEATAPLDTVSQSRVRDNLFAGAEDRTLVWSLQRAGLADGFDRVLVLSDGNLKANDTYERLIDQSGPLADLVKEES